MMWANVHLAEFVHEQIEMWKHFRENPASTSAGAGLALAPLPFNSSLR